MRDSVPSTRYSSICNVLRQWRIWLIPTYRVGRVYRLYDIYLHIVSICGMYCIAGNFGLVQILVYFVWCLAIRK